MTKNLYTLEFPAIFKGQLRQPVKYRWDTIKHAENYILSRWGSGTGSLIKIKKVKF